MKIRFGFILCSLVLGIFPLVGIADPGVDLIEKYPTGDINWTHGVVISKGSGVSSLGDGGPSEVLLPDVAYRHALANVHETLSRLRIDSRNCVGDVMANDVGARDDVAAMVSSARIIGTTDLEDGGMEVTVQMLLHGGFAQLMLPDEIRQVEPIKPLNGIGLPADGAPAPPGGPGDRKPRDPDAFTGLIVDARGIGALPSMVPQLYDERGQDVYSPAFVSREYAVQYGICQYRRLVGNALQGSRVAPRPLLVKGLRTSTKARSQVVISNADAAKLRSSSAHLGFLKQCRVIILLD